ncbi:MAG: DUF6171 family protein [Bacilli bacterium]
MSCCDKQKKKPTFLTKLLNKIFVSDEEAKRRLDICKKCEHLNTQFNQCKICGCFMEVKTKLNGFSCADLENKRW